MACEVDESMEKFGFGLDLYLEVVVCSMVGQRVNGETRSSYLKGEMKNFK